MGIYQGTKFGFVQSSVYDQMGVSVAGRLANASDINLCDGVSVGETSGIGVGLGVRVSSLTGAQKAGINDQQLLLPTSSSTASDFYGIVIRTETGHTDENNRSYMAKEEIATVLRSTRVGGRIWIKAQNAITTGGSLYWVVADTTSHGLEIGGFSGSTLSSDSVDISSKVKVLAGASAGGLALIEVLG